MTRWHPVRTIKWQLIFLHPFFFFFSSFSCHLVTLGIKENTVFLFNKIFASLGESSPISSTDLCVSLKKKRDTIYIILLLFFFSPSFFPISFWPSSSSSFSPPPKFPKRLFLFFWFPTPLYPPRRRRRSPKGIRHTKKSRPPFSFYTYTEIYIYISTWYYTLKREKGRDLWARLSLYKKRETGKVREREGGDSNSSSIAKTSVFFFSEFRADTTKQQGNRRVFLGGSRVVCCFVLIQKRTNFVLLIDCQQACDCPQCDDLLKRRRHRWPVGGAECCGYGTSAVDCRLFRSFHGTSDGDCVIKRRGVPHCLVKRLAKTAPKEQNDRQSRHRRQKVRKPSSHQRLFTWLPSFQKQSVWPKIRRKQKSSVIEIPI